MPLVNTVTIIGRLTRDPELRYLPKGTAVCRFAIANKRRFGTGPDAKEKTSFIDAQCWAGTAEAVAELIKKGDEVLINGEWETESWNDKDTGATRSRTLINAGVVATVLYKWKEKPQEATPALVAPPASVTVDDVPF